MVKLEVTTEQLEIIRQALDWTCRTALGQLSSDFLPSDIKKDLYGDSSDKDWLERRDVWDKLSLQLKKQLHPSLPTNAYKGYSYSNISNQCAAMEKAIGVALQKYNHPNKNLMNVYSSYVDIYKVNIPKITISNGK